MKDYDYTAGHPDTVELCGHCGRRIFRPGPAKMPYCEKCGHGHKKPTAFYVSQAHIKEVLQDVLRFDISPTFDHRGSYSGQKSQEWRALKEQLLTLLEETIDAEAPRRREQVPELPEAQADH